MIRNLSDSVKGRAGTAAGFNTETIHAIVKKVYTDQIGNVTHCDVRVNGQTTDLRRVENASSTNLYSGSSVTLNYTRGNRFDPVISGAGDGGTGANIAGAATSATAGLGDGSDAIDLSGIPFLLTDASPDVVPDGLVLTPGANVLMEDAAAATTSGGILPATRKVSMRVLVATSLPDAGVTTLPDGTLLDLIDSYGTPLGMYRLDRTAAVWRRRDVATGGGGGGSTPIATSAVTGTVRTDITEANPVAVTQTTYNANKVNTDATTAEVVAARTRPAIAPLAANTYSSLYSMTTGIWTAICSLLNTTITAGTGLTGGGNLQANRTISIAAGGVGTTQLADGAVTTAKLTDGSTTTAKLANSAVTNTKMTATGITDGKILKASGGAVVWADDASGSGGGGTGYPDLTVALMMGATPVMYDPQAYIGGNAGKPSKYEYVLPYAADGSVLYYTKTRVMLRLSKCSTSSDNSNYVNNTTVNLEYSTGSGAFSRPYGGSIPQGLQIDAVNLSAGNYELLTGSGATNATSTPKSGDKICANPIAVGVGTDGYTFEVTFSVTDTDPADEGGGGIE